uniref:Polyprotein n=1 Tax=Solanum tuberosum TaxID=4113 RepID=M1DRX1_SOLTU
MSSIPVEFEYINKLVKGFTSYLQKATTYLMLSSGTFQSIIDHVTMIKCIQHAKQGSSAKRFRHQAAIQSLDGISGSKPSQTSQGMPSEYPCQGGRANPSSYFQRGLGPVVILFVRSLGTRKRIAPNVLFLLSSQDHRLLVLRQLQRHEVLHIVLRVVTRAPRVELRELEIVLVVALRQAVTVDSSMIYRVDPRQRLPIQPSQVSFQSIIEAKAHITSEAVQSSLI